MSEYQMSIGVPAVATAFAAFCVWLTVRVINRRERWAKWAALAVIAALMGYPLSFGPAVWMASNKYVDADEIRFAYRPLARLALGDYGFRPVLLFRYATMFGKN